MATPENICPSFKFTDGVKKFSVLSWHLFEHYTNKGWGCSGGLAALAGFGEIDTEKYRTWACIYEARNCDGFCVALLYLYWKLIGCSSGTCMITSKPINSTLYGAVMGYLVAGMFKFEKPD